MPGFKKHGRGSKASYSPRQIREAHHIEQSELRKGHPLRVAQRIGWATVNKRDHGALGKKK